MPHVVVKLWPGKSEQQKARLTEAIVNDVMNVLNYGEESVSVAIEEVKPEDWAEKVYKPDIQNKWEELFKKPGYDPSDL
jgi:4-oxalocrotonate tautomerase